MDHFIIFTYHCLESPQEEGRLLNHLEIEMTALDGQDEGPVVRTQFSELTIGDAFVGALTQIMKRINEKTMNFVNVQLVAQNVELFTKILPEECRVRKLSLPFIFTNIVDWKKKACQRYGWTQTSLLELSKNLGVKEANDEKGQLKAVLLRLRYEGLIGDSATQFVRKYEEQQCQNFGYFKVIGLPYQISKNEIIQKLVEPERFNIKSYGLSLIFQNGKFSGKAVIKIPTQFTQMIIAKDRMFIGKRYVEIILINQQEYASYKLWEERQRQETRHLREPLSRKRKEDASSQSSRSRSRDKLQIHSLLKEAAIKIRGLPFTLNNWDIEQIFKRFNFVRGSVKLGYLGQRKTGQAVILFPNRDQAERAMTLHNLIVQGRYLELRLITKDNFDRFH